MRDRIRLEQGDITQQRVDAIVNAANSSLLGGGGVDGAIHRAAGPELLEACREIGGCPTGEARITYGFNLAGDVRDPHRRADLGRRPTRARTTCSPTPTAASLELARDHDAASVAFPAISTGAYGFPLERATRIAIAETLAFLDSNELPETVTFVCFDIATYEVYECLLGELPA